MKSAIVLFAALSVAAFQNADPETVHITFRPKAGMEAELKKVIADHWATATKLGLVQPEPHVTVEMKDEAGRPYFVDIFTWRDRDIPDNAPAAILTIWADMHRLTEARGDRPGLDIKEVKLVPARASGMQ
jgi:hypothetical protein